MVSFTTPNTNFFIDDFENKTELGPNWEAGTEFVIVQNNNSLSNTATDNSWKHIAVLLARNNPSSVSIVFSGKDLGR